MTKVAILRESTPRGEVEYRAVAGNCQATARTPGAALDALTCQLPLDPEGTLVIVQNKNPDAFFSARQQRRLEELMGQWREARDSGNALPPSTQLELDDLVDAEVRAAGERTAALLARLGA